MHKLKRHIDFINENNNTEGDLDITTLNDSDLFELCITANSGDPGLFREDFCEKFNSAAEVWLEHRDVIYDDENSKWKQLSDIFAQYLKDERYSFAVISGEDENGDNSMFVKSYLDDNWVIFASEQNGDSYEAILFNHPDASRSHKSVNKYNL